MSLRFATSPRARLRPVSCHGILVCECHAQLQAIFAAHRDLLVQNGMQRPDLFLAEPVFSRNGDSIDWYVEASDEPRKMTELPPAERLACEQQLAACSQALGSLIASLEHGQPGKDTANSSTLVDVLRHACTHPSDEDVYFLGNNPVLVNWGMAMQDAQAAPQDILRFAAAAPVPPRPQPAEAPPTPPKPAPVAAQSPNAPRPPLFPGCLSWLLPLLLLLLLLWLLLAALGRVGSPLPGSCFRQDVSLHGEELRSQILNDEEQRLLAGLEDKAAQCRPAKEKTPELPAEKTPVLPVLPDFSEAPALQPGDTMQIPEKAQDNRDLSFLEGCWRSRTKLRNLQGVQVEAEFCFDSKGQGKRVVLDPQSGQCTGKATAKFGTNGQLEIETGNAYCRKNSYYTPQNVLCKGTGSDTHCTGREVDGTRWDAIFTRR